MSNKDVKCLGECKKRDDGKFRCRTKGSKILPKMYKEYQDCNPETEKVVYLNPELVYDLYEAMKELKNILPDNLKSVLLQVQQDITNMINANIIDNKFVIIFKLLIEQWLSAFKDNKINKKEIFQKIETAMADIFKRGNKRMQAQLPANNGNNVPKEVKDLDKAMEELERIIPSELFYLKQLILQVHQEITKMINEKKVIDNEFFINFKFVIDKWLTTFKDNKINRNNKIKIVKQIEEVMKAFLKNRGKLPANNG